MSLTTKKNMTVKEMKAHPLYKEIEDACWRGARRYNEVHFPQYYGHPPRKPEKLRRYWTMFKRECFARLKENKIDEVKGLLKAVNPYCGYLGGQGYRDSDIIWFIYNQDFIKREKICQV